MSNPLFTPFSCRGLTVANRIVMAPMTRSFSPDGIPGEKVAAYYARRAAADVGLVITEGTVIDRKGASNDSKIPMFHGEAPLAGWRNVVQEVHKVGGKIAPQIWHMGLVRKPGTGHFPDAPTDSPSARTHSGKQVGEAPTTAQVEDMVVSYARAAGDAVRLGFDCVEIHGAHGYLIDQFFWAAMNVREDKYGGDLASRATFGAEIIQECRKEIDAANTETGKDMPIILRFSQWKQQDYTARLAQTPEELAAFLGQFVEAGVDILHCSQRRYHESEFDGSDLNLAGWSKKLTGLPTISVGSIGLSSDFIGAFMGQGSGASSLEHVQERLDKGEFDLVAVGRALLQDPEWAIKVKQGRTEELQDYNGEALGKLY